MSTTENLRFFFKGLEIDDKTRDYIEKRIKTLDKFADKILRSEVQINLDKKGKFWVEVIIQTPRNMFLANNATDSIEASVDLVVDELQNQITRLKDKLQTLKKRGGASLKKRVVIDENARF